MKSWIPGRWSLTLNNKNMRKLLAIIIGLVALLHPLQVQAVLTGKNLNQTVSMLSSEMEAFAHGADSLNGLFRQTRADYIRALGELSDKVDEVSLMLYSQQDVYVYGQAYAAYRADNVVAEFYQLQQPALSWLKQYDAAIQRCERLQHVLLSIDASRLSPEARQERQRCAQILDGILQGLRKWRQQIADDSRSFYTLEKRVKSIQAYVEESYSNLHVRVFMTADKTFPQVMASWSSEWPVFCRNVHSLFNPSVFAWKYQQEWARTGNLLLWSFLLSFFLTVAVSMFFYHRFIKRGGKTVIFGSGRMYSYFCGALVAFLVQVVEYNFFITNPFYENVSFLIMEVLVLFMVVLFSVSMRVEKSLVVPTLRSYLPVLLVTIWSVGYRMMLVEAHVLRVTLVPLLLLSIIFQTVVNYRNRHVTMRFDRLLGEISFFVYVIGLVLAWIGRYFLSTQVVVFWTILLTGHLFLSCFYGSLNLYQQRREQADPSFRTSLIATTLRVLVAPFVCVLVILFCIYECAFTFNILQWVESVFTHMFIDIPDKFRVSLLRLAMIGTLGVLTYYFIAVVHNVQLRIRRKNHSAKSVGMVMQVCTILAWGIFGIVSLVILEVNGMGVVAIISGVMVGVGIALRDTIDSFLCGVAMMMGRVKIGDYVMCDDVRGRVIDIQYRTTLIETEDGAVVSFFNTAFFGKNYRNLTGKGKYERMLLNFKLQKDADITALRQEFIQELLDQIPEVARQPAPRIHFVASERFHMELMAEVWVPVHDYLRVSSRVKEVLFLSIRHHGLFNMMPDERTRIVRVEKE